MNGAASRPAPDVPLQNDQHGICFLAVGTLADRFRRSEVNVPPDPRLPLEFDEAVAAATMLASVNADRKMTPIGFMGPLQAVDFIELG